MEGLAVESLGFAKPLVVGVFVVVGGAGLEEEGD
jgi:hypothetical protein